MKTYTKITINFKGGIVSPGYLKDILYVASTAKVSHVRFGLRQQMIMHVPVKYFNAFSTSCREKGIEFYETNRALPNILSSYTVAGIFSNESWLREGVYKDVFNLFDYSPHLKINICDNNQSFVPFFTGHLNWIASSSQHFWHLYIRFPKTQKIYHWRELVYTNDVVTISKYIEQLFFTDREKFYGNNDAEGNILYEKIKSEILYISKRVTKENELPKFSLPYYEGFNKHENNYWLGIYRRDELFPVPFLTDICDVCMQTRIGQLYTTPWKSIIIKGIDKNDRYIWDHVLGEYRINVRHAANELNWQVEDNNEDGLELKRYIIRYFDKEDVRTYGLCFAVQTKPSSSMFGSIIIRRQQNKNPHRLRSLERFDVLYTRDFNPNSKELITFRENVEKEYIGTYLVSLCKMFYEQGSRTNTLKHHPSAHLTQQISQESTSTILYQCPDCFTIYDETLGEPENNISPRTSFKCLPDSYCCPLCETGKHQFFQVSVKEPN